jgi:hypothetical protein
MRALGEDRICPILMFPLPKTLKQLRTVWRVTGYCRIWILGYADLARPLYQILKEVVTEWISLSLFLTPVRVVTERGDLKNGLQEVKETLLPRKYPSASERHLCP